MQGASGVGIHREQDRGPVPHICPRVQGTDSKAPNKSTIRPWVGGSPLYSVSTFLLPHQVLPPPTDTHRPRHPKPNKRKCPCLLRPVSPDFFSPLKAIFLDREASSCSSPTSIQTLCCLNPPLCPCTGSQGSPQAWASPLDPFTLQPCEATLCHPSSAAHPHLHPAPTCGVCPPSLLLSFSPPLLG